MESDAPKNSGSGTFPILPGEDLYAHAATQYLEEVEAYLAGAGLLAVASDRGWGKPVHTSQNRGCPGVGS